MSSIAARFRQAALAGACLVAASLGVAPAALGADGDLDLTFAGDGAVVTSLDPAYGEVAFKTLTQPDGAVVVAGTNWGGGQSFLVQRYLPNGTLDPTFGTGGTAPGVVPNSATSIARQSDGSILVTGYDITSGLVARFTASGALDATFGTAGIARVPGSGSLADVVVQSDDRIVVVGSLSSNFLVARFTANGVLDPTFDGDGIQTATIDPINYEAPAAVDLQSDGRIVIAGFTNYSDPDIAVLRFTTAGALDTTFGDGGDAGLQVIDRNGDTDYGEDIAIDGSDRIYIAGESTPSPGLPSDMSVLRLTANGAADPAFGIGGWASTQLAAPSFRSESRGVALQADGRVVVAGTVSAAGGASIFGLARFTVAGALDTSFGTAGTVTSDIDGGPFDSVNAIVIGLDGLATVVGLSGTSGVQRAAIARYRAWSPVDVCTNVAGMQITIPTGLVAGAGSTCVAPAPATPDVCANIAGGQATIPAGLVAGADSTCVAPKVDPKPDPKVDPAPDPEVDPEPDPVVDRCSNISGTQTKVPLGYVLTGATTCIGSSRASLLIGGGTADVVDGRGGDDTIFGRGGGDTLRGGAGNDNLFGNTGDDRLFGGAGNDLITGNAGNDAIAGNAGRDTLFGSAGRDTIDGGSGSDRLHGGSGNDLLRASDGAADDVNCGAGSGDVAIVDMLDTTHNCERVVLRRP